MKKTFVMEIEPAKTAYNRHKYCPKCGSHIYTVCHLLEEPSEIESWWVSCVECDYEGPGGPNRDIAIARWKQINEV